MKKEMKKVKITRNIYEHSSGDMSLSKYTVPYLAMGSGAEYAYGVLYATDKQKNARNRQLDRPIQKNLGNPF